MTSIVAQVSYILPILDSITGKSGAIPRFRQFGRGWVLRRLKAGASRKDLFYHLVRQYIDSDSSPSLKSITER